MRSSEPWLLSFPPQLPVANPASCLPPDGSPPARSAGWARPRSTAFGSASFSWQVFSPLARHCRGIGCEPKSRSPLPHHPGDAHVTAVMGAGNRAGSVASACQPARRDRHRLPGVVLLVRSALSLAVVASPCPVPRCRHGPPRRPKLRSAGRNTPRDSVSKASISPVPPASSAP